QHRHCIHNRTPAVKFPDKQLCVERAGKRTDRPTSVQPAVTSSAGVKYPVAQRGSGDSLRHHAREKKCPRDSEQDDRSLAPKVAKTFAEFVHEARKCIFTHV